MSWALLYIWPGRELQANDNEQLYHATLTLLYNRHHTHNNVVCMSHSNENIDRCESGSRRANTYRNLRDFAVEHIILGRGICPEAKSQRTRIELNYRIGLKWQQVRLSQVEPGFEALWWWSSGDLTRFDLFISSHIYTCAFTPNVCLFSVWSSSHQWQELTINSSRELFNYNPMTQSALTAVYCVKNSQVLVELLTLSPHAITSRRFRS